MDYKDTINLPKTDFPMKANLSEKEPEILKKWEGLYKKLREQRKGRQLFVLHDGPPYANGNIHIGHALNKILKDIICKVALIEGFDVDYKPGWDCHGLPIEQQVEKELKAKKINKENIPKDEFRRLCREYASKFVSIQKEEFVRLGVLGDWEEPYLTMDPKYEAQEVREIGRCLQNGVLYKGNKPVYWCIYDKTAEAEAEVEYKEKKDISIYVRFELLKQSENILRQKLNLPDKPISIVIWTTTPWTLPANLGVMASEDIEYGVIEDNNHLLLLEKQSQYAKEKDFIASIKGKELIGLEYQHPFIERTGKIYPSEFVEVGTGTGFVHMAPGHGMEDYIVGLRYGLEPFSPVNESGRFTEEAPEFIRGLSVFEANKVIIEHLKQTGFLLKEEEILHSYPHCWRCKNPVIYRATPQWFIGVDIKSQKLQNKSIREKAIEEAYNVKWVPKTGQNRMLSMLQNRPDWCISRQRFWGVPITIFYCKHCGEPLLEFHIFEHVAKIFENSPHGADEWFKKDEKELLPPDTVCKKCGSKEFTKETDILDVWFDSGSSHASVLRPRGIEKADVYLEGSDQHRGWFQASLLESIASYGEAPFKSVVTHGFTVDEKGHKMSKSQGNVISPLEIIKEYGADILRLWVISEDYTEDIKLGKSILKRLAEDYKKIRNTLRYFLGNLYDFKYELSIAPEKLHHFDRYMYAYASKVFEELFGFYKNHQYHRFYHRLMEFISVDLSALYFDVIKDRLYMHKSGSFERLSAQTALYFLLKNLAILLSPVLSFTAEETYYYMKSIENHLPESIFMNEYKASNFTDEELLKDYQKLLLLRKDVLKAIEMERKKDVIKHPYEARVVIKPNEEFYGLLEKYKDYLHSFFTVSQVEIAENDGEEGEYTKLPIKIEKAKGEKCPRCWLYVETMVNGVCPRCAENIKV
ncbi:MAG: isoleucine--tRNA ligase [Hydrogenobaculum sp.]|nr:MAG: isoleucine--tRNA ligase [Hydrogenobaculum sp.]PMP92532.1 MAG: isoleucine--tRNA ligase [Hydrogenobaculum sp.]